MYVKLENLCRYLTPYEIKMKCSIPEKLCYTHQNMIHIRELYQAKNVRYCHVINRMLY